MNRIVRLPLILVLSLGLFAGAAACGDNGEDDDEVLPGAEETVEPTFGDEEDNGGLEDGGLDDGGLDNGGLEDGDLEE